MSFQAVHICMAPSSLTAAWSTIAAKRSLWDDPAAHTIIININNRSMEITIHPIPLRRSTSTSQHHSKSNQIRPSFSSSVTSFMASRIAFSAAATRSSAAESADSADSNVM
eukprot:TRINITY_DN2311_c0_g1_i1.p1 TRINITY_DN2311_c0_g1~~TRINITY_DN2311_c0_g1_i1.p1  ORF type:complete len:111 (-),score=23.33 TRINITY_DN2311_c0_g1_i1:36-368(-)